VLPQAEMITTHSAVAVEDVALVSDGKWMAFTFTHRAGLRAF
jgi:hypothetical protein